MPYTVENTTALDIIFLFIENKNYRKKSSTNYSKLTQPAIACSKLTTETLEEGVKYVQS